MTRSTLILAALATAATSVIAVTTASAHGGKEYFAQTYTFSKPMNGYEGFQGAYHCSYIKTPQTVCDRGVCKKVWTLLQTCQ